MQPPTAPHEETSAKPKVLRRPAQFSRKGAATPEQPAPHLAEAALPTMPHVSPRMPTASVTSPHWQEDGRFGMTMVAVVLAVNVLLSLLLPLVNPHVRLEAPATMRLNNNAAMPATHRNPQQSVRVYTEPNHQQGDGWDLNSLAEDYNEFTTSPSEMPAPTARELNVDER